MLRLTGLAMLVFYVAAVIGIFPKQDGRIVFGDATHHFVQLRSMVFDRDLHFTNDYAGIYGLDHEVPGTEWIFTDLTVTGHVRNYMPVGPALLAAPLYVLTAGVLALASAVGLGPPPDGFDRWLQLTPGVTGVVAATFAALLSWRLTRRYVDAWSSTAGVLATWIGSHAVYYTLVSPAYSHAPSMFACALFFEHWTRTRAEPSLGRFVIWGGLAGFATLMRWQDAVLLLIPFWEALRWHARARSRVVAAAGAGAGFVVAFAPQMVVWTVLYGQPFALPQGPSFMQWTSPHPVAVLFSDNHGLFTWAPLLLLSVAGLVRFAGRVPPVGTPMLVVAAVAWYVNGAVADWWAGEAFGSRRFLSLFPLFSLGLGVWLANAAAPGWTRSWRVAVVLLLVAGNWLLLLQYQLFMKGFHAIATYPHGWPDMWVTRFVVPFRLLQSLWP